MRAVRSKEDTDRNSAQVVSFVADVCRHAAENPHHPLSRILHEHGYSSGASSESDFFGSSGSFSVGQESTGNFGAKAFFNNRNSRTTLQPFVGSLTHRCVRESDDGGEPMLVPWRGDAALLFVDLSGYSKISAQLISSGGAHALSRAVNGYFESILNIVLDQYHGDVIKFAGDAIVIVWAYEASELRENALAAVRCALELQRRVGIYPVEGTDLTFRLHCGVTAGVMDSEVLLARESKSMQRAYHFISGPMFEEIGPVVDGAATGEVCVSQAVADLCGGDLTTSAEGRAAGVRLLVDVDDDANVIESMLDARAASAEVRSEWLEKQLVHPRIASKLRQGFKLSHMAEMRFLCVLFIHKAVEAIAVRDWFTELQQVLDANRCPVVQIIDDDKGTHVIAAVNLYFSEADAASSGLRVARQLEARKVGCAVGMACGETYCGVVGCEDACRWDVTGPACVRAARLMQYAVKSKMPTAIDESVYESTFDVSQLVMLRQDVAVKGSPLPVKVYGLSAYANSAPSSISSVLWAAAGHYGDDIRRMSDALEAHDRERTGHIISGPIGCGKKTMALIAVQSTEWTSVVHQTTAGDEPLSLANTLGEWFSYHPNEDISALATRVQAAWRERQMTHTLDLALKLVEKTIAAGERTMIIAQSAQHIDGQSLALVREILRRRNGGGGGIGNGSSRASSVAPSPLADAKRGKFAVVLTCYPLHGSRDPDDLEAAVTQGLRPGESLQMERYTVRALTDVSAAARVTESVTFWKVTDAYAEVLQAKTGGVAALMTPLIFYVREAFGKNQQIGVEQNLSEDEITARQISVLVDVGLADISYMGRAHIRDLKWSAIAPQWLARYTELYDALPPRLQLVLRAIAALTNDCGAFHKTIFPVVQKLVPKAVQERVDRDVEELTRLGILAETDLGGGADSFVRFSTPAMLEVVQSLLTPDQDRILKRMGAKWQSEIASIAHDTTDKCAQWPFYLHRYMAFLWRGAGDREKYHQAMKDAYSSIQTMKANASFSGVEKLEHKLATDIAVNGDLPDPVNFFGGPPPAEAQCSQSRLTVINRTPPAIEFCKNYMPSPALGALAGEAQKMAYVICNWPLKLKRPHVTYLTEEGWQFLSIDIDNLMAAIDKFESLVPPLPGKARVHTAEQERALYTRWNTCPESIDAAYAYADEFVKYDAEVIQTRRDRVVEFATHLAACLIPAKGTQFKPALSKAFARFLVPTPSGKPLHECAESRSHAFNNALMDLALAGWRSPYMFMTLQTVRDACLRMQTVDIMEVKAMTFSFLVFGTHLSMVKGGIKSTVTTSASA